MQGRKKNHQDESFFPFPWHLVLLTFYFLLLPFGSLTHSVENAESSLVMALEQARDEQLNFQNDKAIATVKEALDRAFKKTPSLADLMKLADAYLLLAYCEKNLGHAAGQHKNLLEAARLNPSLSPNALYFPPSLTAAFEKAKDEVWTQGKFGQVLIQTSPPGARIYLNGSFKGISPLRIDRHPAGDHYMLAVLDDLQGYKKVEIKEGKNPVLKIKLSSH